MVETHWSITMKQNGAGTHVDCACGWTEYYTPSWTDGNSPSLRVLLQSADLKRARRAWEDHDCAGRPLGTIVPCA